MSYGWGIETRVPRGNDSKRLRNTGAGIGSASFWVGMALLLAFFGYLGWDYPFGG